MKFQYRVRTTSGGEQEGTLEANSEEKAIEMLQKHRLLIVSIKPARELLSLGKSFSFLHRVKSEKIVIFAKEISIMLEAGIPLVEALRMQYAQEENPYFKEQIYTIASKVDDGMPFSTALAGCNGIFSDFFINIVRAGEASGKLQETFLHLSEYMEKQHHLNAKVKNALMYPAVIVGGFAVVGIGMMLFVVPTLVNIFKDSGQELPITTKVLIWTTNFMQQYFLVLFVLLIIAYFGFKNYLKTPEGKEMWDKLILQIPGVKKLLQKIYVVRFAGNLSMLIASGIPITDALRISGDIVGNNVYRKVIYSSVDEVRTGGSVSFAFEKSDQIPTLVSKMMRIGEKSGKLGNVLKDINDYYTREIDIAIDGLMSLIEPILIFVLGIGVAIFMSAILLPIYQMTETF